jgi:hypothetical protein
VHHRQRRPPTGGHLHFECVVHDFTGGLFNRWRIVLWLVETLPNSLQGIVDDEFRGDAL